MADKKAITIEKKEFTYRGKTLEELKQLNIREFARLVKANERRTVLRQSEELQKFVLIDWRHEFGGLMNVGDIYYDLSKLYKGIILSDELIKEGRFTFDISGNSVYYNYFLNSSLMDAKEDYEDFIKENGFDLDKVKIITAISLLNMSPLHNYPFNFLVYYLGKNMLHKILTKSNKLNVDEKTNDKL